jgi:hypothetical protein
LNSSFQPVADVLKLPPEIMIHEVHVSVRLALFQVLAVITGVFMTRAVFMVYGYPESNLDWNALALLVRNHGFYLLLAPVVWTSAAVYLENYGTGRWSRRWTVCTGIILLAALAFLFFWSFCNPHNGRM